MAINYTEVGWDTSKYVNPTNMNQMDDGIKAACDGVDELNSTKLDKAGGTMTGNLTITNSSAQPTLTIGSTSSTRLSILNLYSNNGYAASIYPLAAFTTNRAIRIPNADGTLALTSDIVFEDYSHEYTVSANGTVYWNPKTSDGASKSGYTAVGILNMKTNDSRLLIANMQAGTNSSYDIILKNISSDSFSGTCTYRVMYVKS